MQIKVTGHHVSVSPAMKATVVDKLGCIEDHFDRINSVQVVLSLDNKHTDTSHKGHANHKAECILRVPGAEIFAHAEADNMYESIAKLSEKIDRQIVRHKEKTKSKHCSKFEYIEDEAV